MADTSTRDRSLLTMVCDAIALSLRRFFVPMTIGLLAITVFFQVLNRFILHIPLPWTEEIGRYLFVWTSLLAAASGIREKAHLNVELLQNMLGEKGKRVILLLSELITFGFFALLSYEGFYWVTKNGFQVRADSIHIPMFYIQVIVPVSSVIMALFALDALLGIFSNKYKEEGK